MIQLRTIITIASLIMFSSIVPSDAQTPKVKRYTVKVLETLPHNVNSYTQGLFFYKGRLFESSGLYGQSFFHEVDIKKGTSIRSFKLPSKYFAEGAVAFKDRLYLLTWQEREVLVYDINSFKHLGTLYNPRDGWGLTTDGTNLITTDGSSFIYFHDPETFRQISKIEVTLSGERVEYLNELEFINGEIWANIYEEDVIVIINPKTGVVRATLDCRRLLPQVLKTTSTDVLNGIAFNPADGSLYLTGKNWPKMYRVELPK